MGIFKKEKEEELEASDKYWIVSSDDWYHKYASFEEAEHDAKKRAVRGDILNVYENVAVAQIPVSTVKVLKVN